MDKDQKLQIFKFLLLFYIFTSLLLALTPEQIAQAKAAISANPALLHSKEAQKFLQKTSTSSITFSSDKKKPLKVENNIDWNEAKTDLSKKNQYNLHQQSTNTNNTNYVSNAEKTSSKRLVPLKYVTNQEKLSEIKSSKFIISKNHLKRFSLQFFRNKNQLNPNRIVVPNDYVINRGDVITFWIYGATNKQYELNVDARGNINIPQVGPVHVAGEKFSEVKELLTNYLSSSYKNSQVVVDLNSFSTAQVTVTGYVNAPGIYNTTSVSSVKDILIAAGGVSDVGSVRKIEVLRNGQIIDTIDYYHLLTMGLDHGDTVLRAGDVIHVPRAYGLIAIDGEVNTPAIYEIEPGETLAHILKFAGGLKAAANGKRIYVKRYNRHANVEYKTLSLAQARNFITKDGDEVFIGKLNQVDERYIEVIGNVVSEGKKHIGNKKIRLSRFLRQQMKGGRLDSFFLENTNFNYALIKRVDKNLVPKVYHVNLTNVLKGKSDFYLQNRDKLYIFNKLDTQINPYVTIKEAKVTTRSSENNNTLLMQEGKFQYTEGMTLQDLIHMAGLNAPFDKKRVKIISRQPENGTKVVLVDYDTYPDYKLAPFDTVILFNYYDTNPIKTASIEGEVVKPGKYPISDNMTLEDFIQLAGGLNERAYPKTCEIVRYYLKNGERNKKIINVELDNAASFIIQPYDEINIKRIPYWYEKKQVTIKGEVKFPGTYVIHSGEKLSSVIRRAGGFTDEAFLYGAVFTRKEIAKLQKKSLQRSLAKLKEQVILASLRASGSKSLGQISISEGIAAVQSLIDQAEKITPIGRISINLTRDLDEFEYSASNLTLKDGDTLTIPSFNDTVVVSGEVMNPMALTYMGEDVKDYISRCGGLTEIADSDHIYVLHANGEAEKASFSSFLFSSHHVKVKRGDTIIIPKKIMFERGIDIAGDIADIIYKITLTVAAMNTVGVL